MSLHILSQGLADHDIVTTYKTHVDHPCVSLRFGYHSNGERLHMSKCEGEFGHFMDGLLCRISPNKDTFEFIYYYLIS